MKIRSLALASLFALSAVHATTISGKFSTDPALAGWQVFGDTNLFQWNPTNQVLDVTWDSAQPNSYFYHPLGTVYTKTNEFLVTFDLQLADATVFGYGSELTIGLLHFSDATNTTFSRSGGSSPNLFEFDYFPDVGWGDSIDATLIDQNGDYGHLYFAYANKTLSPGVIYQIVLTHLAGATNITGEVFTNGVLFTTLPKINPAPITDFQIDTLSISSYADDGYGDSILAHGSVRNLAFASPLPVGVIKATTAGQVRLGSDTNWLYTLEQTADFKTWTPAAPATVGTGTNLVLQATNVPPGKSFYRVRADLP